MVDFNEKISETMKTSLSKDAKLGAFEVETRIGYNHYQPDSKPATQLTFILSNENIELDPAAVEKHFLANLPQILKDNAVTETEKNHMKRLADELTAIAQAEGKLNGKTTGEGASSIPANYSKWFEELPKRRGWDTKHALNVTKTTTGVIRINIDVPENVDPDMVAKNIEARLDAIKDLLAKRVLKYTPSADTDEKKKTLEQAIKGLKYTIAPSSSAYGGKGVMIQIMSEKQLEFSKLPGNAPPENPAELIATNPLNALKNGDKDDEKGPDGQPNPPHLKKALARAFLFAGDKANEIFPLVAGKDDMRRAITKPLVILKDKLVKDTTKPENADLVKKLDTFLADDTFKDPDRWSTPVEEREDQKSPVRFIKDNDATDGKPYEKGKMKIVIDLPSDKFPAIRDELAGIKKEETAAAPAAPAAVTTPATDDDKDVQPNMDKNDVAVGGPLPTPKVDVGAVKKDPALVAAVNSAAKEQAPAAVAR